MSELLAEYFKDIDCTHVLADPILFGDFRNALEEGEPRIYEDMQDYEACKAIFQEVSANGRNM